MKVAFVIHYPVFGGPHNQALRLDRPLAQRGWEQLVILPDESGNAAQRLSAGGVRVVTTRLDRVRAKPSPRLQWNFIRGFIPAIRRIRSIIRDEEIDLVMIGGLVNPHAAIAARLEKKPVVWQIVDTRTPKPLVALIMPLVRRLANALLVTGADVAAAHRGADTFGDRLFTFFPPVDVESFVSRPDMRMSARAELGVTESDVLVGSISNVNPQKDQMTFVEAAGLLESRSAGCRFAIMGAKYPEHADYVAALEKRAAQLNLRLGEQLIFHDPGSEVMRFGNALDVFAMTSEPRSEGIPTVIEEAMSLGLPVVTTDVGSVRAAVEDGVTGFVVPAKDPRAIAAAIQRLVESPALRDQMGSAGRERALTDFASEHCADIHLRCFEAATAHADERR